MPQTLTTVSPSGANQSGGGAITNQSQQQQGQQQNQTSQQEQDAKRSPKAPFIKISKSGGSGDYIGIIEEDQYIISNHLLLLG